MTQVKYPIYYKLVQDLLQECWSMKEIYCLRNFKINSFIPIQVQM